MANAPLAPPQDGDGSDGSAHGPSMSGCRSRLLWQKTSTTVARRWRATRPMGNCPQGFALSVNELHPKLVIKGADDFSWGDGFCKCRCFQRHAWSVCGYSHMRQSLGHLEDFFGGISTAPCIWQSLVLFGSCLRVQYVVLGDHFWIRRIQRFLVRQWIHMYASLRLRLLFPYSAQFLVLCGTCYASVTVLGKVAVPVLRNDRDMVRQCRKPCWCRSWSLSKVVASLRAAEGNLHGPACSENHGDSAVAVCFLVVDTLL